MRANPAANHRAVAWLRLPPWLWLYVLAFLLQGVPEYVSDFRSLISAYTGQGGHSPRVTAQEPFILLRILAVLSVMPVFLLTAGVLSYALPQVRGWWVERHYRLAVDGRPVIAEMQRFVDKYAPSVQLRVSLIDAGQSARIYPVGWRTARIAVFYSLPILWEKDREAAQAVLLHEIAHLRQGDQLAVGLGSPFVWIIRIWVPAFVVMALAPLAFYFATNGGELAVAVSGQVALQLFQIPRELVVPVTALWLAELGADQLTAQAAGPGPLQRALEITGRRSRSRIGRALQLLSHPPRQLRLRLTALKPAGTVALLAAWPAALIAQLLIGCLGAAPAYLLIGYASGQIEPALLSDIHEFLADSRALVTAAGILLLAWPVLARSWERLWSPGSHPARSPRWQPYLAATALPAIMLILAFAPLQATHSSGLSAAPLRAGLLTTAQLPPGYEPYHIQNFEPTGSSKPQCARTLNNLELNPPTAPGVVQAETAFAQSQSGMGQAGPWLLEIIRSYPGSGAVEAMESIRSTLASCGTFTITWTTPPPASATESVRMLGTLGLGDQSWSAEIFIRDTPFPTSENLDLIRVGTRLIVISHVGSPAAPPITETRSIAATATARLPHPTSAAPATKAMRITGHPSSRYARRQFHADLDAETCRAHRPPRHEQVSSRLPSRLISRASAPEFGELLGKGSALVVTGSSGGRTRRQIHQIAAECVAGVAVREDGFDSAAAGA